MQSQTSIKGREVSVNQVLNNLPLYYMSLFKMPKCVVDKIIRMQRNFFWSANRNKKGLPLIK